MRITPLPLSLSPSAARRASCTCDRSRAALKRANAAIDLFDQKTKPTLRQCCLLAGASETTSRKVRRERHGSNGEKATRKPPPDLVAQAIAIMRQATLEQRLEIFRQFGPEEALTILTDLETATLNGAAADLQQDLPL